MCTAPASVPRVSSKGSPIASHESVIATASPKRSPDIGEGLAMVVNGAHAFDTIRNVMTAPPLAAVGAPTAIAFVDSATDAPKCAPAEPAEGTNFCAKAQLLAPFLNTHAAPASAPEASCREAPAMIQDALPATDSPN